MTALGQQSCQRPPCPNVAQRTYTGPHGNELKLCESCYYNMVQSGKSIHSISESSADFDVEELE